MRDWNRFQSTRLEYEDHPLLEQDMDSCPVQQFLRWYDDALQEAIQDPNAMVLSTVDEKQQADSRVVLLKLLEDGVFYFFTNYESKKGKDLAVHNNAALLFYWKPLHRQVRIQGHIEKASAELSDEYFYLRPPGAQAGAIASPQSQRIASREVLQEALDEVEANIQTQERPEHWGGYGLQPHTIEFWQGRRHRLHDRVCYQRTGTQWEQYRLAP